MTGYSATAGQQRWQFTDLKDLLAKATPLRSGDCLAGLAAGSSLQRVAAQMALADLPLKTFLNEQVISPETDEVSQLIIDSHDPLAFAPISHLTVGDFRNWLLSDQADSVTLKRLTMGLTPEMVAAVSKLMRVQDLILVASKCRNETAFRNSLGGKGV